MSSHVRVELYAGAVDLRNTRTFALMERGQELFEYSCSENNRCEGGKCVEADVQKSAK